MFITVFEQVLLLFIFAIAGYTLAKTGLVKSEHSKILSTLLVYLFLPCNVIKTFNQNFTIPYITKRFDLILVSIILLAVLMIVTEIIVRLIEKEKYRQTVYRYSLIIPNIGYMGWPFIGALWGDEMMLSAMIFCLPLHIYIYTYGYAALTKGGLNLKTLLNPTVISLVVGIILGLTGIKLPEFVLTAMDKSSACMAPVSMILAGIVISEYKPKEILKDWRVWLVTALRLIVFPFAIGLAARPFVSTEVLAVAVALAAMPCGLNTIVFPRLVGEDCKPGAALGLISNILACGTIPLCITVLLS
ncbi:MAG: AEC family transporter [Ruminococcaceae bacterium]|nr:AEC family transporter [Oscillospiraceae bacterium]